MVKEMVEICLIIYLINVISVVLHELGHLLAAFIVKMQVNKISIGNEKYSISIGKLTISPIIFDGYVECLIEKQRYLAMVTYLLAGPFVNLLIVIFAVLYAKVGFVMIFLVIINSFHFLLSVCPFIPKSDCNLLMKETVGIFKNR